MMSYWWILVAVPISVVMNPYSWPPYGRKR